MDSTWGIETKCAIVITDSYRPQFSDAFEVKGRVMRVGFQELKVLVGQRANIFRESLVRGPKPWRSGMFHRGLALPCPNSARASAIS